MRRYVLPLVALLSALPVPAMEWTADDYARVAVVAPDAPTAVEQKAVDVWVEYWQKCTGARPDVVTTTPAGPAVWFGAAIPDAWIAELGLDALGVDGVAMKFFGEGSHPQLALGGGEGKGVLYAVYEFFERYFGVKWLAPGVERIPPAPARIANVEYTYTPPFIYRVTELPPGADADTYRLASPFVYGTSGHSLYDLLPPEKYFRDHPEWYSEIRGARIAPSGIDWHRPNVAADHYAQLGQLCMTNAEVARALADAIIAGMAAKPQANVWSISQMDWGNWCTCSECSAVAEREGTQAGPFLLGVNRVAELLEGVYPDLKLQTYAYTWTRKPPKSIRPHKNVMIQLCTFECDFARPLNDPESRMNQAFVRDYDGWQALDATVLIYDYPANCRNALRPSPTEAVLGPNIRLYADRNAIGVFEQGRAGIQAAFGFLKPYLIAKLMWDPSLDVDTICREFMDGYYGAAAPFVFEYMLLARQTLRDQGVQMFLFDGCGWVTRRFIEDAHALFEKALEHADTPETRTRVAVERVQVMYGAMLAQPEPEYLEDTVLVRRASRMTPEAIIAHIVVLDLEEQLARPHEIDPTADGFFSPFKAIRQDYTDTPDEQRLALVTLENERHRIWIVPEFWGSVMRWQDKTHGRELLKGFESFGALPGAWQDWEDRNTLGERAVAETYAVVEQTPVSVTLEATTAEGLIVRRTMRFAADDPAALEVIIDVVNTADELRVAKVKTHPEFYTQRANIVPEIWIKKSTGWERLNTSADPATIVWGEFIWPESTTEWAFFVGEAGYGLLNTFRPEDVSRMLYYYNTGPGATQVNLELLPLDDPIAPGATRSLRATYRPIASRPGEN